MERGKVKHVTTAQAKKNLEEMGLTIDEAFKLMQQKINDPDRQPSDETDQLILNVTAIMIPDGKDNH